MAGKISLSSHGKLILHILRDSVLSSNSNKAACLSLAQSIGLSSRSRMIPNMPRGSLTNKATHLSRAEKRGRSFQLRAVLKVLGNSLTNKATRHSLAEKMAFSFHSRVVLNIPVYLVTRSNSKTARLSIVTF